MKSTDSTTPHHTTPHHTALHHTTHHTTLHCTTLHYTTLHFTSLQHTTPHHITHCTTPLYTTLNYTQHTHTPVSVGGSISGDGVPLPSRGDWGQGGGLRDKKSGERADNEFSCNSVKSTYFIFVTKIKVYVNNCKGKF